MKCKGVDYAKNIHLNKLEAIRYTIEMEVVKETQVTENVSGPSD